ncbi:uncharacterized protein LOC128238266 [Mya arenaria]|uniref:uncharacterized protein LOC128238266 n=1 Tax=Mya arenaria TaxID=6604 RepID=UPI0022E2287B|nr:uncharacterized protein LOC128238266 [Mya arenaria]XP_052809952.1 uncharacterized protein LOC128238266 [Mya arenaria]XP_052809953.1 uncharacterized protein LOC128238266 [Mya arenaria]
MSTADVKVVVLRSPNKKKPGYFTLSIDIVPKKNADSVIKKRQKENYEVDECIVPPTSPDIELPLDKDKKCKVKLIIEGGLKPAAVMHDGEDIIEYSEKGARKVLLLVPNNVSDNASIVFKVGGRFKERINIVDVPCQTETVSPGLAALNISGGATSRDQTSVIMTNADTSSTGDSTELKTSYRGGDTSYDAGNLAKPVLPNSGVTSVPDVSDDVVEGAMPVSSTTPTSGGQFPDGGQPLMAEPVAPARGPFPDGSQPLMAKPVSPALVDQNRSQPQFTVAPGPSVQEGSSYEADESAYKNLLSNKSLKVLANVIGPNDFNALIILLEVPAATVQQERRNHPGDIGSANFVCLHHWRSSAGLKGENSQEADKDLFNKLIEALTELRRIDIKRVLLKVLEEGPRHLSEKDFPYM